jgi:hypothetical protein
VAKLTIAFGVLLGLVGLKWFFGTGSAHPTALIPLWFGIALIACGALAMTENARRRMLWMHVAVTIGLVGFLFPGFMSVSALVHAHTNRVELPRAQAVYEQLVMAILCMIFTLACVRSFIVARRGRTA